MRQSPPKTIEVHASHLRRRGGENRRTRTVSGRLSYQDFGSFCRVGRDFGVQESVLVRLMAKALAEDPGVRSALAEFLSAPASTEP